MSDLLNKKCMPCEGGVLPFDVSEIHKINNEGFELYDISKVMPVILSFNFFRLSELQEFLFVYYFFWHSFFLKQNLLNYKNKFYTN